MINLLNIWVHTSVYDKLDNFSFPVTLLTFPDSMIPRKMGPDVFASQVVRYLSICSHIEYVVERTRRAFDVLVNRGYVVADFKTCNKNDSVDTTICY